MFSGIVQAVGCIASVAQSAGGVTIAVDPADLDLSDVHVGDSICVQGVCLTAIDCQERELRFDVSAATLEVSTGLDAPGAVNLEKSLRFGDRVGGHLVQGHVDGVGTVLRFEPIGQSYLLEIELPQELARYVARKGSIALNGVSLTTNEVQDRTFSVNLIPHTVAVTTLKLLSPGSRINVEIDLLARYLDRLQQHPR